MGFDIFIRLGIRAGLFAALTAAAVACSVETGSSIETAGGGSGPTGSTPCLDCNDAGAEAGTVSAGSPTPSPSPMLARVDDGVKMTASPGEGVGLFSEYDSGGRWHLWWTCDTNLTGESCPFDVRVTVEKGAITNAAPDQLTSTDTLTTPSTPGAGETGGIEVKTVTTKGSEGVFFDTDPGGKITLTATIGGLYNGKFLFWVEGGQVNGGFTGTVTDPLMLVGAAP
jgi:hypothetical protein